MKLFFDGGCRPCGMELAVVVGGRLHIDHDLGPGSSMDAEWLALIQAMRIARDLALNHPLLLGDALAVIAQATGKVRCPSRFLDRLATFRAIEGQVGRCRIRYVKRNQNLAGIALARASEGRSDRAR